MRMVLLSFLMFVFSKTNISAQYPDLPGGGGNYNLQTMPSGSYVIAMDNKYQASGAGVFSTVINNRAFNYTAGNPVITAFTNTTGILTGMEIRGQAAIPAGAMVTAVTLTTVTLSLAPTVTQTNKPLDFGYTTYAGKDFNLRAYGLLITLLDNNVKLKWIIKPGKTKDANDFSVNATKIKPALGAAADIDFAGGPFVIFSQDTAGVAVLVQAFNGAASADDVKLYRTNADVVVDIRYSYFFNGSVWKPKGAILNDGNNAQIHAGYMQNAGVPVSNYTVEPTAAFITNCYTFASEPHNTSATAPVIQGIRTFVENGSNFLAQCAAVNTYELSVLARFQSTNGFTSVNGGPATTTYSNSDLAYFQINGNFAIGDEGGSLKDWQIPVVPGNPPVNNFHVHTTGTKNGVDYTNASVSKLRPVDEPGGMVFYLGSHSYDGNNDYDINGQRLYMNALMIPTQSSLKTSALIRCPGVSNGTITFSCGSSAGPSFAYPLTFTLYQDLAPAGYNAGDPQLGNVVTMTAPNTYPGGISQITAAAPGDSANYVVVIRPTNGCKPNDIQAACMVLLVKLASFNARRNGSFAELRWKTASEQHNIGFYVERSTSNGNWQSVGFVNSLAPDGNSDIDLSYSFNDPNNTEGISQYRLRQMDADGRIKFSEVRTVQGEKQGDKIIIYPNPSPDGNIIIVFDAVNVSRDISVIDMSGRTIEQTKGITNNSMQMDNLAPGMYSLKVKVPSTGELSVKKIVVFNR